MATEIEIKLKVDDLPSVRDRLNRVGAKRIGERLETNIFFDTKDRVLLAKDSGLRLRCQRNSDDDDEKLIITFKGPRSQGAISNREEIEVKVDDLDAAVELLSRLGYQETQRFEKRRESWRMDRCHVELDTMPQLGTFVEIEARSEADVQDVQQKLELVNATAMKESYATMVANHLKNRGDGKKSLTFD